MKYKNESGKQNWKPRRGQQASRDYKQKTMLIKKGLLQPDVLYSVQDAIKVAGI